MKQTNNKKRPEEARPVSDRAVSCNPSRQKASVEFTEGGVRFKE